MQPKAWKTLVGLICNSRSFTTAGSITMNNHSVVNSLHESMITSEVRVDSHNSTTAELMDNFNEDELHSMINDMLIRNDSNSMDAEIM